MEGQEGGSDCEDVRVEGRGEGDCKDVRGRRGMDL